MNGDNDGKKLSFNIDWFLHIAAKCTHIFLGNSRHAGGARSERQPPQSKLAVGRGCRGLRNTRQAAIMILRILGSGRRGEHARQIVATRTAAKEKERPRSLQITYCRQTLQHPVMPRTGLAKLGTQKTGRRSDRDTEHCEPLFFNWPAAGTNPTGGLRRTWLAEGGWHASGQVPNACLATVETHSAVGPDPKFLRGPFRACLRTSSRKPGPGLFGCCFPACFSTGALAHTGSPSQSGVPCFWISKLAGGRDFSSPPLRASQPQSTLAPASGVAGPTASCKAMGRAGSRHTTSTRRSSSGHPRLRQALDLAQAAR